MRRKKILLLALLCFLWASCSVNTCMAERTLTITETQLTKLEYNNKQLMIYNEKLLKESSVLKEQVKILQQQLIESKTALSQAQQSLKTMSESTEKLERKIKVNKIGASIIVSNNGVAPGLSFRFDKIDIGVFYSNKTQSTTLTVWF